MKSPLHILHLEDTQNDADLVHATLESSGIVCTITHVDTRDAFIAALQKGGIDLILSDFTLPEFDGLSAAEIVRTRWSYIPLIFVSGTLSEDLAIDLLKSGAVDYVLKGRLTRLAPAVRRAMQEVEAREERKQLEAQIIEGQKMEVIGHLAGGVAHDFGNILAIIMGYNDLTTKALSPDSPLLKYTEAIRFASERAAGLTRQLLVFSRKQTATPVVINLNQVVSDMDKMLKHIIDHSIELTIALDANAPYIKADSGYVGQVVMNLVVNARDAMPDGGKLVIATCHTVLNEIEAQRAPDKAPGNYAILSVSDTGTGMTEEVKKRLFETFFTTKPKGKGTGLGLPTCQTIVQQSGGFIDVDSELGKGTTFKIYFPRIDSAK